MTGAPLLTEAAFLWAGNIANTAIIATGASRFWEAQGDAP
jgi:hypothetical protein